MNKIEKLRALSKAGTSGPWDAVDKQDSVHGEETYVESNGKPVVGTAYYNGLHALCSLDDSKLICQMRNNFDALLAIAEAVDAIFKTHGGSDCPCSICKALKAFEEIK